MHVVYESKKGRLMDEDAIDGMAALIEEAEAAGFEGEHVFDASVEDPPHPFWNAKEGRCYTDAELAAIERQRKSPTQA